MDSEPLGLQSRREAPPTVLVAEPDPILLEEFHQALVPGHRVVGFSSAAELLSSLARPEGVAEEVDAVILSDQLGDPGILQVVTRLRESPSTGDAALIVSHQAAASPQLDALAAQGVVFYFLRKPFRHSVLHQVVSRGAQATWLRRENARLREQLDRIHGRLARENRFLRTRAAWTGELKGLLGQSPALQQVLSELERVRVTDATVHLHGETGTGKELMARALHQSGPRAQGPFLAVNCAGMPESLLQSTLFGHRRGSFTGADRDHSGLFTEADGGTLFLDEVAELPPSLQAALLRAVQEREVTPVGATRAVKVDVRLISATHADLRAQVEAGRFREDLYFRLMVVAVRLPPLRERLSDVPLLANHFVHMHRQRLGRRGGELTEGALRVLTSYHWPGNVRELEHEMERLVVLSDDETPLGAELLSPQVSRPAGAAGQVPPGEGIFVPEGLSYDDSVELLMRRLIDDALASTGGGNRVRRRPAGDGAEPAGEAAPPAAERSSLVSLPARAETRREVRLACWLHTGGGRVLAHTSDLSSQGLSVQLPWTEKLTLPQPGDLLGFQLALGESRLVEGTARVSWVDGDDRDSHDRRVAGLGLELVTLEEDGAEALRGFVLRFRHQLVLVDADPEAAELYAGLREQYEVFHCQTPEEALEVLAREEVAVLLTAEDLPGMDCLQFFNRVSETLPKVAASRVVACEYTAVGQLLLFVNLGKLYSYLRKPFDAPDLHQTVRRAVDGYVLATEQRALLTQLARANERLREENAFLRQRSTGRQGFEEIVGHSAELRRTLEELVRVQRADSTVHLHGETGTGKELCARALHSGGRRRAGPFVVQGCAGISEGLVQSTFFGYRQGAFTGADRDHPGVFQQADGGTLFLDEVGELSAPAQAALLRVLQEGEVHPLGAPRPVPVDVRILSSSSRDLREEVQRGRFREDLFFRLMVLSVRIPPLRERAGDVAVLAAHFLDSHCERRGKNLRGFTAEAMRALEQYRWPGNVRELSNEIERVVVFADEDQKVHAGHLSRHLRPRTISSTELPVASGPGLWVPSALFFDEAVLHLERALVQQALEKAAGNVTQAAAALKMERSRLAKLKERLFPSSD